LPAIAEPDLVGERRAAARSRYLQRMDKTALKAAEEAFLCFEPYRGEDGQGYARASRFVPAPCETEVVDLLKVIRQKAPVYPSDPEEKFSAEQNAVVAVNAAIGEQPRDVEDDLVALESQGSKIQHAFRAQIGVGAPACE